MSARRAYRASTPVQSAIGQSLDLEAEERERLQNQIGRLRLGRHGREASVTPDLARRVRKMRASGVSVRAIAEALGLSKSAVARAVD
jgi:DNA invertase Pin-like site-specific DNA recombinase